MGEREGVGAEDYNIWASLQGPLTNAVRKPSICLDQTRDNNMDDKSTPWCINNHLLNGCTFPSSAKMLEFVIYYLNGTARQTLYFSEYLFI